MKIEDSRALSNVFDLFSYPDFRITKVLHLESYLTIYALLLPTIKNIA